MGRPAARRRRTTTLTRGAVAIAALAGLVGCERDPGLATATPDQAVAIDAAGQRDAAPPDLVATPDLRVCNRGSPRAPRDPLPVRFPTRASFATGGPSYSVVTVDADRDGHLDLILSGGGPGQGLRMLRGRGDGTFEAPVATADPSLDSGFLFAADLDHRGGIDVVEVGTALHAYLGCGDGTFRQAARRAAGGRRSLPRRPRPDGRLDVLLVGDVFGSKLVRGLGGGKFAAPAPVSLPHYGEIAHDLAAAARRSA